MDEINEVRMPPTLDARLALAVSMTRGGTVLDVGTDHAYIPIYLAMNGHTVAGASDINEGPLERAMLHAKEYGVYDKILFYRSDGLDNIDFDVLNPQDIIICGMGGELIVNIVTKSAYVRQSGIRLILQPMTRPSELSEYLSEKGFAIVREGLAKSAGKLYRCIAAEYTGVPYTLTPAEKLIGKYLINNCTDDVLFCEYIRNAYITQVKIRDGRRSASVDTDDCDSLISEIRLIAKEKGLTL